MLFKFETFLFFILLFLHISSNLNSPSTPVFYRMFIFIFYVLLVCSLFFISLLSLSHFPSSSSFLFFSCLMYPQFKYKRKNSNTQIVMTWFILILSLSVTMHIHIFHRQQVFLQQHIPRRWRGR